MSQDTTPSAITTLAPTITRKGITLHWSRTLRQYVTVPLAAALFLAITQLPAGCAITHYWPDDGSAIAVCSDGSKVIAYDPDGQTHPAAPYRAPGTWYAISQ
jgi:hypothetical protein